VAETVKLDHQEHATQVILPGIYKLWQVQEVDPFTEEVQAVQD